MMRRFGVVSVDPLTQPDEPRDDSISPGRLSNGWDRIARDLRRAWALSRLDDHESVVLDAHFDECWTAPILRMKKGDPMPEPQTCRINISDLARDTGFDRPSLQKAFGRLVAARMLHRQADGRVAIGKDYTAWTFPARPATKSRPGTAERPRLSAGQLAYVRRAIGPFRISPASLTTVSQKAQTTVGVVSQTTQMADGPVSQTTQEVCLKRHSDCVSNDTVDSPPTHARGIRDLETGETLKDPLPPAPDSGEAGKPSDPSGLIAWIRTTLHAAEWETDYIARVVGVARRWLAIGGDPAWCASAVQASLNSLSLEPSQYAEKILLRMERERKEGLAVEAPALCAFRRADSPPDSGPDPVPPSTRARPARSAKAERDAAAMDRLCNAFDEAFTWEDSDHAV